MAIIKTGVAPSELVIDSNGMITVNTVPCDGNKATYSANILGLVSVATATDIFTIYGSATKTIKILRLGISATQTTGGAVNIQLIKRSTANTGGTSASSTAVVHDSNDGTATATVLSYTANPTALGTTVGVVRSNKLFVSATTVQPQNLEWFFGNMPDKALILRGTTQGIALNLNGVTVTAGNFNIFVEWTEE